VTPAMPPAMPPAMTPMHILDTGAVMAYAHGTDQVGAVLADAADATMTVTIPGTCLLEAYSLLDAAEHDLLRILLDHPAITVSWPAGRRPAVHRRDGP